jgi:hypothetical protein
MYITRPDRSVGHYSRLQRGWRRLAFWAGDIRVFPHFPYIGFGVHSYKTSYDEWLEALKYVEQGDIGVSTKHGFIFSNMAIPGVFKHAFIFTQGPKSIRSEKKRVVDVTECRIVEAISEGVVERHPIHALSDKMMILRPVSVTDVDATLAADNAKRLVGSVYDDRFRFDIEDAISAFHLNTRDLPDDDTLDELHWSAHNSTKAEYDVAFSCTEVVATAWWHRRRDLQIYRHKVLGRLAIIADQFVNPSLKIVWTNLTMEEAAKAGMEEDSLLVLDEYWRNVRKGRSQ